jgi:hypothetical protein
VNRILRITADQWVTGRAIRWACEDARLAPVGAFRGWRCFYTHAGTSYWGEAPDGDSPAITVTVERDQQQLTFEC